VDKLFSIQNKKWLLVSGSLFIAGCSGSTEDVRLTLCKDLVPELTGGSGNPEFIAEDVVVKGYEDLQVRLSFNTGDQEGKMVCFYPYNTHEENVIDHVNPAAAFDTYPNKVMLNGETLDHSMVAKKINQVLIKQGKQAIEKVKQIEVK